MRAVLQQRMGYYLAPFIARLNDAGIRVSLFISADPAQIEMAARLRAPVIEIHTGGWCDAVVDGHTAKAEAEWQRIVAGAALAACDTLAHEGVEIAFGVVSSPLELADEDMRIACASGTVITVEDHNVRSGLGVSVAEWIALNGAVASLTRIGVTSYQSSGPSAEVLAASGLDEESVRARIRAAISA